MKQRTKVAITGIHDGNAGQVAEWFEEVTGCELDCFVVSRDEPIVINALEENKKRVSQKMEYPGIDSFKERPLIYSTDWTSVLKRRGVSHILPMDSCNADRWVTLQRAREAGFSLVSAIHPTALLLDQCEIEPGVWINAKVVIGYKAEIRTGAMINTGAIIEHHNVIESCAQVDPGVVTGGNVTLRARSHVHLGAVIVNRIEIGEDAVVGAGSMVRQSVPPLTLVYGVPAKHKRDLF
jgi:sugar O-acyltransferase (sialic acid O-acetyltransferase NeuD family)